MKILALDPGYALVGWSVVEHDKNTELVDYGCFETLKNMGFEHRLEFVYTEMSKILKEYKPNAVVMEELFFHTNAKTVINVAQARGVLMLCAVHHGVEVFEYTPLQVKMALTGYGRADKKQVQWMVQKLFKLAEVPQPDDAADALAVAYCHSVSREVKS